MNNTEIKQTITQSNEVIANMNIYTKLQKLRKDFHSIEMKKSGENKFAGFKYFELKDFLPVAVNLLEKYNMTTIMTTTADGATLTLINGDNPSETIEFYIPDAQCQLKGCTDIQSLGGKITYQKRYLYVNLLDVCENDTLDAITGKDDTTTSNTYKLSEKQINRMIALGKKISLDENTIKGQVLKAFNKNIEDMTREEYDRVCNGYINKAEKQKEVEA